MIDTFFFEVENIEKRSTFMSNHFSFSIILLRIRYLLHSVIIRRLL